MLAALRHPSLSKVAVEWRQTPGSATRNMATPAMRNNGERLQGSHVSAIPRLTNTGVGPTRSLDRSPPRDTQRFAPITARPG